MSAALTSLPSEITLDILDLLDFHSLKHMRQANQLFRCLVTKDRILDALIAYERELHDNRGGEHMGLPCYTCLNILPVRRFYTSFNNVDMIWTPGDFRIRHGICVWCRSRP